MVKVDKSIKMQGWERKSVLRNTTIGKRLPDNILNVPKKGFGIPLREWFKKDTFQTNLSTLDGLSDVLAQTAQKNIIDDNIQGERDNGSFIWELVLLSNTI